MRCEVSRSLNCAYGLGFEANLCLKNNVSLTGLLPQTKCLAPSRMCNVTDPMLKLHIKTALLKKDVSMN